MKIGIAADHGGYLLKEKLKKQLSKKYEIIDYGAHSFNAEDDYPDFALSLGEALRRNEVDLGIGLCTTGIGMSITLNKIKDVRCAKVNSKKEAYSTRFHNNSNAIGISGRLSYSKALKIVNTFLTTPFSNEERHIRRIEKIKTYDN